MIPFFIAFFLLGSSAVYTIGNEARTKKLREVICEENNSHKQIKQENNAGCLYLFNEMRQ